MSKLKTEIKNIVFSIGFLFRPITPIAFSLAFLVLTSVMLVVIILNLDENTKTYEILLAILTGVTASLLIAILMELYNNYRFNTKRQRELREYFRQMASYELEQSSFMETNANYGLDNALGSGRAYAVFCQLKDIIPTLRKTLNVRDYLYRTEIDGIDDILYDYDDLVKIIRVDLLGTFMGLVYDNTDEVEAESESNSDFRIIDDLISDYPLLFSFLAKEAKNYNRKKNDVTFHEEVPEQLESIIEKAIFFSRHIFNGYFEVTDTRSELVKLMYDEEVPGNEELSEINKRFEFRSNMISYICGNIDKAMIKLQKRVAKEPYFWIVATYKKKLRGQA